MPDKPDSDKAERPQDLEAKKKLGDGAAIRPDGGPIVTDAESGPEKDAGPIVTD